MSALNEIEAAIKRLTKLKAESTQWQPDPDMPELAGWYVDSDGSGRKGVFTIKEAFHGGHAVALYADPPDAELIVTLHRTIDAQLAILKHAIGHFPHYNLRGAEEEEWLGKRTGVRDALTLARAINNTAS